MPRFTAPMSLPMTLLCYLGVLGCGSFGPQPEVTLVGLEFQDLTLFESSGVFTVRLANPRPEAMVVDGGVYNLYLDGVKVGKALSDARVELPRLSTATVEVPVYVNNLALATRIAGILERKTFAYTMKGKLYLQGSFGRRSTHFHRDGNFDFQGQPDALDLEEALDAVGPGQGDGGPAGSPAPNAP